MWPNSVWLNVTFGLKAISRVSFGRIPLDWMSFGRIPFVWIPFGRMPFYRNPFGRNPVGRYSLADSHKQIAKTCCGRQNFYCFAFKYLIRNCGENPLVLICHTDFDQTELGEMAFNHTEFSQTEFDRTEFGQPVIGQTVHSAKRSFRRDKLPSNDILPNDHVPCT